MKALRVLRDPWVLGQLVLFAAIGVAGPRLAARWPGGPAPRVAGALAVGVGLLWIAAAARTLGRNLTPAITPRRSGTLVAGGLYRATRHPMYGGLILLLGGYVLCFGSWRAAGLVALAAWLFFEGKGRAEEARLRVRFPEYDTIFARTPRLVPWRGLRRDDVD